MKVIFEDLVGNTEEIDQDGIMLLNATYKAFGEEFYLGSTATRSFDLQVNKDFITHYDYPIVKLYDDNDDLIAVLNVDKLNSEAKYYYDYELVDNMVKFDYYYDASEIFVDGSTTLGAILQDMCDKAGVVLETDEFDGDDIEVSWYDNRVTARDYLGMIAEVNGGYARINKEGELELVKYENTSSATIDLNECEDFTIGEYHKITRVVFDNGVLVAKYGDDTGDTLYLNTTNVFINSTDTVEMIYNSIQDFEFYSLSTTNNPIPDLIGGEIATFTDGTNSYPTIVQYEIEYFAYWYGKYSFNIKSITQQETKVRTIEDVYKSLMIEQDRTNAQVKIVAEETQRIEENTSEQINDINNNLGNNYYTKAQSETLIINSASGLTNTFSEAGGNNILRNTNFSANEVLETGQIYEYWFGNVLKTNNNNSANGMAILLQNDTLYQEQQSVANGPYTISFYYKKLNPVAIGSVIINGVSYELTEDDYTLFQTGLKNDDGTYKTQPVVINDNYLKIQFISDTNNGFEIYDIMCNYGTIKLAYSQNQNETVTNTVNISKGITITASDEDVKLSATPDGIRIKNKNTDEIITDFTDEGAETDNLLVKKTSTNVGIFRQKVGNQVWDSLL